MTGLVTRRTSFQPTLLLPAMLVLTGLGSALAAAQPGFENVPIAGQIRDTIIDPAAGVLYAAVYDRNEIVRVDLASRTATAAVAVGKGPARLALSSDGATLAALNRLENTLTLIAVDSFSVIATLPCGEGVRGRTALPGGFAVTNSFADSVTLVDTQTGTVSATIENVASVPNSVAASASFLGITTRVPAQLLLYAGGSRTPTVAYVAMSQSMK